MKVGIYPGSFDPVTNGHLDIIQRAAKLVDKLYVAILHNPQKSKGLFDLDERVAMLQEVTAGMPNVEIETFAGLLVDYARQKDAAVIIRGLRAVTDFEYEMQMAQINKNLLPTTETICLVTGAPFSFLSSSVVRELASFKGNFYDLVPPYVARQIEKKIHLK